MAMVGPSIRHALKRIFIYRCFRKREELLFGHIQVSKKLFLIGKLPLTESV